MATAPNYNQANLLQRPASRPTLNQMRAKLATTRPDSLNNSAHPVHTKSAPRIRHGKKSKNQSWIWVVAISVILISANYLMFTHKEKLMDKVGMQRVLKPLSSPKGMNEEDKALFWAYVAYAPDQLGTRYKISSDAIIDPEDAKHHLASILSKGVTFKVRKEILALSTPAKTHGPEMVP